MEKKIKTTQKFMYPNFETINWFAALKLYKQICDLNMEEIRCPNTLLIGLKALVVALKQWNSERDVSNFCIVSFEHNIFDKI